MRWTELERITDSTTIVVPGIEDTENNVYSNFSGIINTPKGIYLFKWHKLQGSFSKTNG